jgi:beta-lactam-binding protein with PASTA domain
MDNNSTKNWLYNIGAALVVFGIVIFAVYLALGWYTKHDVKIPVPNVVGQTVSNAEIMMQNEGLTVKIIDSVYNEKAQPFSIIEQIPAAGNEVKPGRAIYVVINSGNKPKIKMPKLVDQSLTLATAVLKNNGLILGEISYSFDEIGNNLVVSQKINGREVAPGTLLTKGTRIDLVIISNDREKFPDAVDSTSSGDETPVPEDIGN